MQRHVHKKHVLLSFFDVFENKIPESIEKFSNIINQKINISNDQQKKFIDDYNNFKLSLINQAKIPSKKQGKIYSFPNKCQVCYIDAKDKEFSGWAYHYPCGHVTCCINCCEKKEQITRSTISETDKVEKNAVKDLIKTSESEKQEMQDDAAENVEEKEIIEEIYNTFEFEKYKESISSLKEGYEKMKNLDSVSEKFVLDLRRELMVFNELKTYFLEKGLLTYIKDSV